MASVFKRGRWVDAQGRKCPKGTPGATWQESRFWTVQVFIDGKPKLVKGYTDRTASLQLGAKLERAKARGEQGMVDVYKPYRNRPLADHVKDYVAELRTVGRDEKYVYTVEKRLAKLLKLCGWALLGDIAADSFCEWRENPIRQRMVASEDKRIGPRTMNQYLEAARAFCRWCVRRKRIATNPLTEVGKVDETGDVRRERRALTADELARLLAVVPDHYRLGYQMLMATGLRRGELLALRWGDVKLNAPYPFIQLRAANTKSKRADALPLRMDLADLLRQAKGDADDVDTVVRGLPPIPTHRKYLAAAGIPWTDDAGRRADLHALRHSYGTLLSKGGVSPREAMSLMRHTDLRLTMKVYTDPRVFDLAGAVEKLPINLAKPDNAQAAKATGTDGKPIGASENLHGAGRADESIGRSERRSSPLAELGVCSAGIGRQGGKGTVGVSPEIGGNWQQKTLTGIGEGEVRHVGLEPTTR